MKNAEKFKEIFKEFATEVWAFPEKDFLTWLNAEYEEPTTKCDSKFCPDRKAKTTNMETILHCIENDCVAYKDGKCLKYNSDQEPTTKNDLAVSSGLDKNSQKLEKDFDELVEIDLYSVIKQKYIEREVLDKIRAEIETKYGQCDICEYFEDYDYEENDISEYRQIGNMTDILQILDKYKAESEE